MRGAVALKRSLAVLALLWALAGGSWLAGWLSIGEDPSIVFDDQNGADQKVENGSAYDRAAVDLGSAKKVVLPDDAEVRRSTQPGKVELFMKKTLAFGGHPPEPMSIRGARKNMGCAVKAEGSALMVATFGEWDSHIEGGAYMRVIAVVPEGVELEQRQRLSGEDSAGREWNGQYLTKPKDAKGGYWYGPASPADGWTAIPDVPDRDCTAQGLGRPNRPVRDRFGK
jgi:hypothetical protein